MLGCVEALCMDAVEARDCGLFLDLAAARAAELSAILGLVFLRGAMFLEDNMYSPDQINGLTVVHVERFGPMLIENQPSSRQ